MARFLLRRALGMALVMFAVSVLVFVIFQVIPAGDPAVRMAGKNATPLQVEQIRETWHFDAPLPEQYLIMMRQVLSGSLVSYTDQTNVLEEIGKGLPRTLSLALGAAILWIVLGVALGLYSAVRAGRISDRLLTVLALVGVSMPVFLLGALMSYFLGYKLGWFPNGGYSEIAAGGIGQWAYHLVLPWVALAILYVGVYSRVLRSSVLDTIDDDYVRTARAKGISERRVLFAHVLRNALIPVITLWGLDLGVVIGGGAVLTETVFDLQGVGQYFAQAIGRFDVPPVLAVTLLGAFLIVFLNTLVDVVYALLDPRVRVVS
ncbi:ABC transporter permease [Conexibacter woesei]|uniref:Binding-protein-dependent transport systems inner membrane component n=1 Tax=Conexibacter woesei (strain DSM 14684 / CCUG 47730 / CIP 108061 / JCM 11494 / NBRC 100937 / ID131577) TaxID=469383 RepID=D3F5D3_CONWI|nr:ABC transporter permease [Conexibacter woesei]ADB50600.1 binding-protein-dependent transport systems inner membrane component [Conexibacter woesei DSM 14684]